MKTLKYALKKEWYNIILLLLPFLVMPFISAHLPDQIPTHWNLQGEVDDYSSKTFGLIVIPLINMVIYLMLLYLPKIDPKRRITIDQKPIPILRTLLILLMLGIYALMVSSAMNAQLPSPNWLYLGLGVFFIVMGNYLRTIQPNYFIGIRVPWALEDPENWRRTHKLGSYLWVTGGILLLLLFPFFKPETYSIIFGIIVAIMAIIPMIYSFYLYKTNQTS